MKHPMSIYFYTLSDVEKHFAKMNCTTNENCQVKMIFKVGSVKMVWCIIFFINPLDEK